MTPEQVSQIVDAIRLGALVISIMTAVCGALILVALYEIVEDIREREEKR